MGNATIVHQDEPSTPCWSCRHFLGLHTRPFGSGVSVTVNCAERGRFWHVDPDRGCKHYRQDERLKPAVTDQR